MELTKEQQEACEALANRQCLWVCERGHCAGKSVFINGFKAAQSPEMLMLNPHVKKLIEALNCYENPELYESIDETEAREAMAHFKGVEK